MHLEKCIDSDDGTISNPAAIQIPGDYGIPNGVAASNIPGELVDSQNLDEGKITSDQETSNSLGGTDMDYTCDYYKHNAEKCGKHGNNEDGKCCSCKPAGKANFFHAINCSE